MSNRRVQPTAPGESPGTATVEPGNWLDDLSRLSPPPGLESGARLQDRYELRERLGRGGYAVVYSAHDESLGRDVAIKVLHADRVGAKAFARLKREVKVARDVPHPNLLKIWDVNRDRDHLFLVMERISGSNLRERLMQGPLDPEAAIIIGRQILLGLQALHDRAILHRDLKPANVLLDADDRVVIADFGLASYSEGVDQTRLTATDGVVGTLEYLAPEQICGAPASPATDLYACGLILYEMLSGSLPYRGSTSLGIVLNQLKSRRTPLAKAVPGLPVWLGRFVDRLLETRPEARYPSATEALTDLDSAHVRPRWRRGPLAVSLAAGLLVAAAFGAWFLQPSPSTDGLRLLDTPPPLRVVDDQGRTLWQVESPNEPRRSQFTLAQLDPGSPRRVVGLPWWHFGSNDRHHDLQIYEARTGRRLETLRLPGVPPVFESLRVKDRFHGQVVADDTDGDGVDEILVQYVHDYFPSYVVYWNPATSALRTVFVASGHHRYAGALDVDDDGRRELLFIGISNRLGWHIGLAAVRLQEPPSFSSPLPTTAYTPDLRQSVGNDVSALVWYRLLDADQCGSPSCVAIDEAQGMIRLTDSAGETVVLDRGGFELGKGPGDNDASRQQRRRAYADLREARRLSQGAVYDLALERAERAGDLAQAIGDENLHRWIERVRARTLAEAGRPDEANLRFESLFREPEIAHDVAHDAGESLYLAGRPQLALDWFERGFSIGGHGLSGRNPYEYLIACTLVGASLDPGRVAETIRRYEEQYPGEVLTPMMVRHYLQWATEGRVALDASGLPVSPEEFRIDLYRYWWLEWTRPDRDPEALLLAIRSERQRSAASPLLDALAMDLHREMGHDGQALALARQLQPLLETEFNRDILLEGHRWLVEPRLARIETRLVSER